MAMILWPYHATDSPFLRCIFFRSSVICFQFSVTVPSTFVSASNSLWNSVGDYYQLSTYRIYHLTSMEPSIPSLLLNEMEALNHWPLFLLTVWSVGISHYWIHAFYNILAQILLFLMDWIEWIIVFCGILLYLYLLLYPVWAYTITKISGLCSHHIHHLAQSVSAIYCLIVDKVQVLAEEDETFQRHHCWVYEW
jgi:hypothetical protein